jgi:predicted alpha/beta-fold hydrolase
MHFLKPRRDFRPLPGLGNPHVQTILGNYWKGPALRLATQPEQVILPDGDQLMVHVTQPVGWRSGQPIALLVHGLGGSHQSGYMHRLAALLLPRGYLVCRLDMRGAGAGMKLARRTYHSGCSDDLRAVARALHARNPSSPMAFIGFSLGGNVVLKLAGQAAREPVPGLAQVAAVSPPVDLVQCSILLSQPRNRFYERHYVQILLEQVRQHATYFPDRLQPRFPRNLTLRQFDDLYTAPLWGFAGVDDYYQRASSLPLLERIQVPTLVVSARDDPFITVDPWNELSRNAYLEARIVNQGGHLGFLGRDGTGGVRWAEAYLAQWLAGAAFQK